MSPHPDLSRSGAEKYNRVEIAFVTCDPDMISEALRATPAPRVQYILENVSDAGGVRGEVHIDNLPVVQDHLVNTVSLPFFNFNV